MLWPLPDLPVVADAGRVPLQALAGQRLIVYPKDGARLHLVSGADIQHTAVIRLRDRVTEYCRIGWHRCDQSVAERPCASLARVDIRECERLALECGGDFFGNDGFVAASYAFAELDHARG